MLTYRILTQENDRLSIRALCKIYDSKFVELMSKIAGVVAGLGRVLPPDVPDFSWEDLRSIPKLAGPLRRLGRKNINELLRVLPMPITAKYAPYDLRVGDWEANREPFTEVVLDTLAEYAPNIRDLIIHKRTLVPPDLEKEFGLPEGNPNHGEMTLDQFFHMRPIPGYARYRTPVDGLYLCGAGTHPGGGVTGIPGQNAAREILRDKKF